RNLGIILDPSLSFDAHIRSLSKTSFFHLQRIVKLRPFICRNYAETLVHALITSRLDYCNSLFSGLSAHSISLLQYIQNSAARMLTSNKKSAHITPILFDLHWRPPPPPHLFDLLSSYVSSRSLRSSNSELRCVPRYRLSSAGGRSFSVIAPILWNSLPIALRTITTLTEFKSRLKTHLFNLHYQ
ncbi:hypothetical protein C0J45_11476, partial [Silurus meridionalis]